MFVQFPGYGTQIQVLELVKPDQFGSLFVGRVTARVFLNDIDALPAGQIRQVLRFAQLITAGLLLRQRQPGPFRYFPQLILAFFFQRGRFTRY